MLVVDVVPPAPLPIVPADVVVVKEKFDFKTADIDEAFEDAPLCLLITELLLVDGRTSDDDVEGSCHVFDGSFPCEEKLPVFVVVP